MYKDWKFFTINASNDISKWQVNKQYSTKILINIDFIDTQKCFLR